MEINYSGTNNKEEIIDCFLGIINDCTKFNASGAEEKILTLELLLKEEGVDKALVDKLNHTKMLVSKLFPYCTHCKEHEQYLNELRHSLSYIHDMSLDNYENRA